MNALNIASVTTNTIAALQAGDSGCAHCVKLQADFAGCDRDTVKATLLPIVAKYENVALKVQGSGRVVMTGDKTAVNTATRKLNRLIDAIVAKVDDAKEEIEVPADILAAAAKLWALCAEYEKAGTLCAKAIATVKAG